MSANGFMGHHSTCKWLQGTNTCKYALKSVVNALDSKWRTNNFVTKSDKEMGGGGRSSSEKNVFLRGHILWKLSKG
jgi:hypothetical protein